MATRHILDPQNPHYQEGRRLALEMKLDHILAEARRAAVKKKRARPGGDPPQTSEKYAVGRGKARGRRGGRRQASATGFTMTTAAHAQELFRRAEAVCFDVDSTVIREEGIDELAKFCGVGDAVTEMTRRAMGGSVSFHTALSERLSIIKCSREQVNKLLTDHPPQLTPGIKELVEKLHQRNVKVFLISGGFRCIVEHVASQLLIPLDRVFANRLKFYFNGEYAGFDESQPTAQTGGKGTVIRMLKEQYGFENIVMIGDGATDLEACPPASAFIGFGGNVVRQQVKEKSSWYVTSFWELLKELEKI